MIYILQNNMFTIFRRVVILFVLVTFCASTVLPQSALAQAMAVNDKLVALTPPVTPPLLMGVKVNPNEPFKFNFILNPGDNSPEDIEKESRRLIKYFLASLTIPDEDFWVNLSPYEKNRIIPNEFGATEMGRDMLAQDYLLKRLTASLIYPEKELGEEFWQKVYDEAYKKYGTTDIPFDTFNKVWIVPEKAVVFENDDSAFVVESRLKVMMEQDYMAQREVKEVEKVRNPNSVTSKTALNLHTSITSNIIKQIIIPAIEREVNEGEHFATLRQIYNSMILATWYKRNMKGSLLSQIYVKKNKIKGVDIKDKNEKQRIYEQYLVTFQKGIYNYIKEDYDPNTQSIIPRKYFSGGIMAWNLNEKYEQSNDAAMLATINKLKDKMVSVVTNFEAYKKGKDLTGKGFALADKGVSIVKNLKSTAGGYIYKRREEVLSMLREDPDFRHVIKERIYEKKQIDFKKENLISETGSFSRIYKEPESKKRIYKVAKFYEYNEHLINGAEKLIAMKALGKKMMIPKVLSWGVNKNGEFWMELEWFENPIIMSREDFKGYPPAVKLFAYINVAEVIAAIHKMGFAHNDLRPWNMVFNGEVGGIFDFGKCTLIGEEIDKKFMNQKHISTDIKGTEKSDIFTFGSSMREDFLARVSKKEYKESGLEELFETMTNENPLERPSMKQVVISLNAAMKYFYLGNKKGLLNYNIDSASKKDFSMLSTERKENPLENINKKLFQSKGSSTQQTNVSLKDIRKDIKESLEKDSLAALINMNGHDLWITDLVERKDGNSFFKVQYKYKIYYIDTKTAEVSLSSIFKGTPSLDGSILVSAALSENDNNIINLNIEGAQIKINKNNPIDLDPKLKKRELKVYADINPDVKYFALYLSLGEKTTEREIATGEITTLKGKPIVIFDDIHLNALRFNNKLKNLKGLGILTSVLKVFNEYNIDLMLINVDNTELRRSFNDLWNSLIRRWPKLINVKGDMFAPGDMNVWLDSIEMILKDDFDEFKSLMNEMLVNTPYGIAIKNAGFKNIGFDFENMQAMGSIFKIRAQSDYAMLGVEKDFKKALDGLIIATKVKIDNDYLLIGPVQFRKDKRPFLKIEYKNQLFKVEISKDKETVQFDKKLKIKAEFVEANQDSVQLYVNDRVVLINRKRNSKDEVIEGVDQVSLKPSFDFKEDKFFLDFNINEIKGNRKGNNEIKGSFNDEGSNVILTFTNVFLDNIKLQKFEYDLRGFGVFTSVIQALDNVFNKNAIIRIEEINNLNLRKKIKSVWGDLKENPIWKEKLSDVHETPFPGEHIEVSLDEIDESLTKQDFEEFKEIMNNAMRETPYGIALINAGFNASFDWDTMLTIGSYDAIIAYPDSAMTAKDNAMINQVDKSISLSKKTLKIEAEKNTSGVDFDVIKATGNDWNEKWKDKVLRLTKEAYKLSPDDVKKYVEPEFKKCPKYNVVILNKITNELIGFAAADEVGDGDISFRPNFPLSFVTQGELYMHNQMVAEQYQGIGFGNYLAKSLLDQIRSSDYNYAFALREPFNMSSVDYLGDVVWKGEVKLFGKLKDVRLLAFEIKSLPKFDDIKRAFIKNDEANNYRQDNDNAMAVNIEKPQHLDYIFKYPFKVFSEDNVSDDTDEDKITRIKRLFFNKIRTKKQLRFFVERADVLQEFAGKIFSYFKKHFPQYEIINISVFGGFIQRIKFSDIDFNVIVRGSAAKTIVVSGKDLLKIKQNFILEDKVIPKFDFNIIGEDNLRDGLLHKDIVKNDQENLITGYAHPFEDTTRADLYSRNFVIFGNDFAKPSHLRWNILVSSYVSMENAYKRINDQYAKKEDENIRYKNALKRILVAALRLNYLGLVDEIDLAPIKDLISNIKENISESQKIQVKKFYNKFINLYDFTAKKMQENDDNAMAVGKMRDAHIKMEGIKTIIINSVNESLSFVPLLKRRIETLNGIFVNNSSNFNALKKEASEVFKVNNRMAAILEDGLGDLVEQGRYDIINKISEFINFTATLENGRLLMQSLNKHDLRRVKGEFEKYKFSILEFEKNLDYIRRIVSTGKFFDTHITEVKLDKDSAMVGKFQDLDRATELLDLNSEVPLIYDSFKDESSKKKKEFDVIEINKDDWLKEWLFKVLILIQDVEGLSDDQIINTVSKYYIYPSEFSVGAVDKKSQELIGYIAGDKPSRFHDLGRDIDAFDLNSKDMIYIHSHNVREDFQREGIGKQLFLRILSSIRAKGYRYATMIREDGQINSTEKMGKLIWSGKLRSLEAEEKTNLFLFDLEELEKKGKLADQAMAIEDFSFSRLSDDDWKEKKEEILGLIRKGFNIKRRGEELVDVEDTKNDKYRFVAIDKSSGKICGFVSGDEVGKYSDDFQVNMGGNKFLENTIYLHTHVVSPELQFNGLGLGNHLQKIFLHQAKKDGYKHVSLVRDVNYFSALDNLGEVVDIFAYQFKGEWFVEKHIRYDLKELPEFDQVEKTMVKKDSEVAMKTKAPAGAMRDKNKPMQLANGLDLRSHNQFNQAKAWLNDYSLLKMVGASEVSVIFSQPAGLENLYANSRELYQNFEVVRNLYDRAVQISGLSLEELFLRKKDIRNIKYYLLAHVLYNVALYRALEEKINYFKNPKYFAGSSLGNVAALVLSGAVSLKDIVRFIQAYVPASAKLRETLDYGIFLIHQKSLKDISPFLKEGEVELLQDASPTYIALAVFRKVDFEKLKKEIELQINTTPTIFLTPKVHAAHLSAFKQVVQELKLLLDSITFNDPDVPIISSTSPGGKIVKNKAGVKKMIEELFVTPVYYSETIRRAQEKGTKAFFEIGPGNKLAMLNHGITPNIPTISINGLNEIQKVKESWESSESAQVAATGDQAMKANLTPENVKVRLNKELKSVIRRIESGMSSRQAAGGGLNQGKYWWMNYKNEFDWGDVWGIALANLYLRVVFDSIERLSKASPSINYYNLSYIEKVKEDIVTLNQMSTEEIQRIIEQKKSFPKGKDGAKGEGRKSKAIMPESKPKSDAAMAAIAQRKSKKLKGKSKQSDADMVRGALIADRSPGIDQRTTNNDKRLNDQAMGVAGDPNRKTVFKMLMGQIDDVQEGGFMPFDPKQQRQLAEAALGLVEKIKDWGAEVVMFDGGSSPISQRLFSSAWEKKFPNEAMPEFVIIDKSIGEYYFAFSPYEFQQNLREGLKGFSDKDFEQLKTKRIAFIDDHVGDGVKVKAASWVENTDYLGFNGFLFLTFVSRQSVDKLIDEDYRSKVIFQNVDFDLAQAMRKYSANVSLVHESLGRVAETDLLVLDQLSRVIRDYDSAMSDVDQTLKKGGIDLNPAHLDLEIRCDESGKPLDLEFQPQELIEIDGLVPVIIQITPLNSLPQFLGLKTDPDSSNQDDIPQLSKAVINRK